MEELRDAELNLWDHVNDALHGVNLWSNEIPPETPFVERESQILREAILRQTPSRVSTRNLVSRN